MKDRGTTASAVYGLGFIGALIYYLQHATSLWLGIAGVVKAVIWPAILVYQTLSLFKL